MMAGPSLTPRKRDILRAVVHDYVLTAEPVGSRTLSRKYELGLSAATIRNELSDLEEEGLLRQPHTSAGRVPSDRGYRVFVNDLMDPPELPSDKQRMVDHMAYQVEGLQELLHQTARLTAVLAGCTALVRVPRPRGSRIRTLSLVRVSDREALLALVTSSGAVTSRLVPLPAPIADSELLILSSFLNAQLRDRPLDTLTYKTLRAISARMERYQACLADLGDRLIDALQFQDEVIVANTSHLARQPEFQASSKVGHLLAFLESGGAVVQLMDSTVDEASEPGTVQVRIGSENALADLAECSLVSATYGLRGQTLGEIAVLGPTRLDYSAAVSVVRSVSRRLSSILTERFSL